VLNVGPFSSGASAILLNKATGLFQNLIQGLVNALPRWDLVLGNSSPESGSNAGSQLGINRYTDAGALIDTPFLLVRSTGQLQLTQAPYFANNAMVGANAGQPTFSITTAAQVAMSQYYYNVTSGNTGLFHLASGQTAGMLNNGAFDITSTLAYKVGGGSWTDSSDARIKTIQGDYALGLEEVLQLRPVTFAYRGNDTRTGDVNDDPLGRNRTPRASAPYPSSPHFEVATAGQVFVGLIAQEVEALFPGMVSKRAGFIDSVAVDDLRDLNLTELTFALVNAVKTLAARVTTLEAAA
jgi:Chaperone of endosialidase